MNQQEKLPLSWNIVGIAIMFGLGFAIHSYGSGSPAQAGKPTETLNPGYVGCVTEQDLTAFNAATHRMQVSMMVNNKCIPTSDLPAHEYVILEGVLVAHVRLMLADDQYADLYVPREATMRDRAPEVADVSK